MNAWTKSWLIGPLADPTLVVDVGNILYQSSEARSPVARTQLEGIITHHWPLNPIVKTVLNDAVELIQRAENGAIYTSLRVPTELMFRLTASDWDTVLVHCLSTWIRPISRCILLFRSDRNLFDFVCDYAQSPDTVLETLLNDLYRLYLLAMDQRRKDNVMQRLHYMVKYTQKHNPDAKLSDIGSILLLPWVELVDIVEPIVNWDNATFTVPDEKDCNTRLTPAVAMRIARRLDRSTSEQSRAIAKSVREMALAQDFSTKMDLTE